MNFHQIVVKYIKVNDVIDYSFVLMNIACVAGVNGEGEGELERGRKTGGLGARDEGTPASKTAHLFSGNPIKLTVNATTNQKQPRTFLHD